MRRLGVITGIAREADCLSVLPAERRPLARCSGASSTRALAHARALIAEGCHGLVSFGIAGGLHPDLAAGTVIVADRVIAPDGRAIQTSEPWRQGFVAACRGAGITIAAVAGSERIVGGVAEKRALAATTGAAAVDMESHAVAAAAAEAGVPVLVVRAVADTATRRLPEWVVTCVAADGSRRWGAVAAGVLRNPGDLGVLMALAGDSARAIEALRGVAGRAGPLFSLP